MGHESQRRRDKACGWKNPYTFDESVEVTVNLFLAHAMDQLKRMDRGGWSWTFFPEEVTGKARRAFDSGKGYPALEAGEKLAMFL